jgi:thioredoxin 1
MTMTKDYAAVEPARAEIDARRGVTLVEFGSPWCGHCRIAQPALATALAAHPDVHHIKIEDGSGRRLGRSFQVKLWPTLIFIKDGIEVARVVRPRDAEPIKRALEKVDPHHAASAAH